MPLTEREANKLVDVIKGFVDGAKPGNAVDRGKTSARQPLDARAHAGDGDSAARELTDHTSPAPFEAAAEEALYQKFKARLLEELPIDPVLMSIVMARPEIRLLVERREVQIEGKSLKGRIAALIAAGYLDDPKRPSVINKELNRTGGEVNSGSLSKALVDFRIDGLLTEDAEGWRKAPGVNVTASTVSA